MGRQKSPRSGTELMLDLAQLLKAAVRTAQATAVAGLPGAAAATVKETLPSLMRLVVGILILLVAVPMIILTAPPNILSGYESSDTESVAHMTQQTMVIGGTYMNLEELEHVQVDSVVTSIVQEYESRGEAIDRIEVVSHFEEDDLLWLIVVNSVAHQQDLNTMSAEDTRGSCVSRLHYTTSLGIIRNDDAAIFTITIEKLKPEHLMGELDFDEGTRIWAGTLYEVLGESDALSECADYFKPYRPGYGGDSGYNGEYEYGGSYGTGIDISRFVSPGTKNNVDLAAYVIQAWKNSWEYVWGTFGNALTESLLEYKIHQYPGGVGNYKDFVRANWLSRRTTDCVRLIEGYGQLDTESLPIQYGINGISDYDANQMYRSAINTEADHGSMPAMPEIMGLAAWKEGHIGTYIGDGCVIETAPVTKGAIRTQVEGRGWQD